MTQETIDQLIQQYGRPAFELAMRQVYINTAIWTGAGIVFAIGGLVGVVVARRFWSEHKAYTYSYESTKDILAVLAGVLAAFSFVVAAACFSSLTTLLNPEFAALRLLMGTVR